MKINKLSSKYQKPKKITQHQISPSLIKNLPISQLNYPVGFIGKFLVVGDDMKG